MPLLQAGFRCIRGRVWGIEHGAERNALDHSDIYGFLSSIKYQSPRQLFTVVYRDARVLLEYRWSRWGFTEISRLNGEKIQEIDKFRKKSAFFWHFYLTYRFSCGIIIYKKMGGTAMPPEPKT